MKRFILTVALVVATFTSAFAQSETYRNAARSLIEVSGSAMSPENMKKTITGTIEGIIKAMPQAAEASSQANKLLERINKEVFDPYFGSDDFTNDMVAMMAPTLEKEFTEAEAKELVQLYSTPEAKAFTKKGGAIMGEIGGMMQKMMPAITAISQGGEAPKVEKVECSAEYRKQFMEYYALTSAASMAKMEAKLAGNNTPQAQKLISYMKEAMPELILDMTKDNLTIDDLKVGVKVTGNPLAQRCLKACQNIDEGAMQPMMQKLSAKMSKLMMGQ